MKAIKRSLTAFCMAVGMAGAHAQTGVGDVVYVPTPQIVVDEMLAMAKVNKSD